MLQRLSTTQQRINRVSSNPGDALYDQKAKRKLVSEYTSIGKTALLQLLTGNDVTQKGIKITDAKWRLYPEVDVPESTPAETIDEYKARVFGAAGAVAGIALDVSHLDGDALAPKSDIFDVLQLICAISSLRTCKEITIQLDSFHTPHSHEYLQSLVARDPSLSVSDLARTVELDDVYLQVFGQGLERLDVFRSGEPDEEKDDKELNYSAFHIVHGLRFCRNTLVSLCLNDVGLGYHAVNSPGSASLVQILCNEFLVDNYVLRHLDIADNRLDDDDMHAIAKSLDSLPLQSLDISLNTLLTVLTLVRISQHCALQELAITGCFRIISNDDEHDIRVDAFTRLQEKGMVHFISVDDDGSLAEPIPLSTVNTNAKCIIGENIPPAMAMAMILSGKMKPTVKEMALSHIESDLHLDVNMCVTGSLWHETLTREDNGIGTELNRVECDLTWAKRKMDVKEDENAFVFVARAMMTIINYEGFVTVTKRQKSKETQLVISTDVKTKSVLLLAFDTSCTDLAIKCDMPDEPTKKAEAKRLYGLIFDACRICQVQQLIMPVVEYMKLK